MSVKTISQLQSQIQTNITSNTGTRGITAPILGGTLADMVDSLPASDKNTAYVTCATQGGTDAKTIDLTDFNLSTGVRLLVKMEHAITSGGSAISLEINSTGAKPLIYNGVAASSSNTWSDNDILDIYYNGTQYVAVPFLGADDEPTEDSRQLVRSGGVYDAIAGSADGVKEWADDLFAKQDGSYDTLAAGTAKNLEGGSEKDWTGMGPHVTGNDTNFDFGNGLSEINKIEGNSSSWNQYAATDTVTRTVSNVTFSRENGVITLDGTATADVTFYVYSSGGLGGSGVPNGHKAYLVTRYISGSATVNATTTYFGEFGRNIGSIDTETHSSICSGSNYHALTIHITNGDIFDNYKFHYILIDLTVLGIDNYTTVAQVENWLDKNIGLKPYYPYDAGSLLSVKMQGIKTVGRNLCSVSGTTGTANLPAYDYDDGSVGGVHNRFFISGTYSGLSFTDCYGTQSNPVPDSGGLFSVSNSGVLTVSGAGSDVYVCMDYDGTYSDAESAVPYEENTRYIDVTHIYGKQVGGSDTLVQVFPNGMRGVGTVHDELNDDGTAVSKVGVVDLGDYDYTKQGNLYTTSGFDVTGLDGGDMVAGRGRSVVWKQIVPVPSSSISSTKNNVTVVDNRDGSYTISTTAGGASANTTFQIGNISNNIIVNDKYLIRGVNTSVQLMDTYNPAATKIDYRYKQDTIITIPGKSSRTELCIYVLSETIITTPIVFKPQIINLTAMFGAGNEPSTVEEFEALMGGSNMLDYYAYDTGSLGLINNITYATAAAFKTAMDGVQLQYRLTTPLEYTDLVYQNSSYYPDGMPVELGRIKEDNWGTEEIVPKNADGQAVTMCSPTVYMTYALDAVETIKTMIDSGIHTDELKGTMENLVARINDYLGEAMGGTVGINPNPVDKAYTFYFTPTPVEQSGE